MLTDSLLTSLCRTRLRTALALLLSLLFAPAGWSADAAKETVPPAEVRAAVAANFTAAMKELSAAFTAKTGHPVVSSFGASGQLVAQIANGAPFDIMLAADNQYTAQLVEKNLGVGDSRFVYAQGKLALWSASAGVVDTEGKVLKDGKFEKIAVANPKLAPYGRAAEETLKTLDLFDKLQPRFVTGENIGQTQQFVASGAVPLGFVALAQVYALSETQRGSFWIVPAKLYQPLDQEAVLLKSAEQNVAAKAFLAFIKSPEAQDIIRKFGYELPGSPTANTSK